MFQRDAGANGDAIFIHIGNLIALFPAEDATNRGNCFLHLVDLLDGEGIPGIQLHLEGVAEPCVAILDFFLRYIVRVVA